MPIYSTLIPDPMARTPSTMLPLGTIMPSFDLPNVNGGSVQAPDPDTTGEKGTLVMFICNHCPYVKHVDEELRQLHADYKHRGIESIAIMSNDVVNYPDDSPEKMAQQRYAFPYLFDETQEVAKAFQAACTPDFFLFDANDKLVYRGQLDDSRPGNGVMVTGKDLRAAMDAVVEGKAVSTEQVPSLGCNIKWKS